MYACRSKSRMSIGTPPSGARGSDLEVPRGRLRASGGSARRTRHRSCRPPLVARTTPIGCTRRGGGTAGGSQPTRAGRAAGAGQRAVDVPPATRRFADERRVRPQRSAIHAPRARGLGPFARGCRRPIGSTAHHGARAVTSGTVHRGVVCRRSTLCGAPTVTRLPAGPEARGRVGQVERHPLTPTPHPHRGSTVWRALQAAAKPRSGRTPKNRMHDSVTPSTAVRHASVRVAAIRTGPSAPCLRRETARSAAPRCGPAPRPRAHRHGPAGGCSACARTRARRRRSRVPGSPPSRSSRHGS